MLYGTLLWGKSDNVNTIDKLQKTTMCTVQNIKCRGTTFFKPFNFLTFNDTYTRKS